MDKFKRKLRVAFWIIKAFLKKHAKPFFAAIIIGFLSFSVLNVLVQNLIQKFSVKNEIIGVAGNYTLSSLPRFLQDKISFGLTTLSPQFEASPGAALTFEATDSGKTYIFNLRNDLVWHDGKPFTAKDVNYNLKDVEINILSDFQIQFKLKDSFSPLPVVLSQPLFKKGLIGLGNKFVLNIKYQDKFIQSMSLSSFPQNNYKKEITTYRFYPTNDALISAFKLGEVQKAINLTSIGDFRDVKDKKTIIEKSPRFDRYVALFYNTTDKFLSDKNNRLALTYALPRNFDETASASSPINPNSWAYNDNLKTYTENLDQAKKLLDKSIKDSTPSAISTESSQIKLTLTALRGYEDVADKIKKEFERISIETDIEISDFPPNRFQLFLTGVEIPSDPDQYPLWHSTQSSNISGISSPRIDKLLEDGRKLTEKDKRLQKYLDFQRVLIDEMPAAFLYYPTSYTLTRI